MAFDKEKLLGVAQKYILKGQSKKAVKELQKLVESSPTDSRLRLKLGDLHLRNGDNENAFKEYLRVAELYEEEDLNVRAISIYKKILSVNPNYVEALHKIAKLYLLEGLQGSAKNCYQTILKISPNDPEALSALEKFNHDHPSREPQARVPEVDSLPLRQRPASQQRVISQEKTAAEETDLTPTGFQEPLAPAEEIEELPPPDKDAEMHYHLGIAYREMDLFDYAITEFETAAEDRSIRFDCYMMLGTCCTERGDYSKAIDYFLKASQIKGLSSEKSARLQFNLGLAYEANSMIPEAIETFRLVLRLDPTVTDARERIEKLQQIAR